MTDHFVLDVHPETLRSVARKIGALVTHLEKRGSRATDTPGEIGDEWTGDAAASIKTEMTGLGGQLTTFSSKFEACAEALRSLAKDYEKVQDDLPGLNQKWEQTETDYDAAVKKADATRKASVDALRGPDGRPPNRGLTEDLDRARTSAVSDAAETRRVEQHNLTWSWGLTKQWLAHRTRETSTVLQDSLVVKVTAEEVAAYRSTSKPPSTIDLTALASLALAQEKANAEVVEAARKEAADDLAELEKLLGDDPTYLEDPKALAALLEELGAKNGDPFYAKALLDALGADGLNDLYNRIDQHVMFNDGEPMQRAGDWEETLTTFNDVVAAGVAQLGDEDLARFHGDLTAPPDGSAPRFGLIAASRLADARTRLLALATLDRMNNGRYQPGQLKTDVAEQVLMSRYGGPEELSKMWAKNFDADEAARFLNELPRTTSQWIAEGLIDDGWNNYDDGPFHKDVWNRKADVWLAILQASEKHGYPAAVGQLIHSIHAGLDTPEADRVLDEVAKSLNNPDFVSLLANNLKWVDKEEVAKLFKLVGNDVKIPDLIQALIERREGTGPNGIARDVGFLLGVLDLNDTKVDYGPVLAAVIDGAMGKALEKVPVGSEAYSVLKALFQASVDAEKKYDDFGKNWAREEQHNVLAWSVWISEHGEPPGFAQWVADNQNRINDTEPDATIDLYLSDLKVTPGEDAARVSAEIQQLADDIREGRDIGKGES